MVNLNRHRVVSLTDYYTYRTFESLYLITVSKYIYCLLVFYSFNFRFSIKPRSFFSKSEIRNLYCFSIRGYRAVSLTI